MRPHFAYTCSSHHSSLLSVLQVTAGDGQTLPCAFRDTAQMDGAVQWHEAAVPLYVTPDDHARRDHGASLQVSSTRTAGGQLPEHIFLFASSGGAVHAAPVRITIAPASARTTAPPPVSPSPEAGPAAPPAPQPIMPALPNTSVSALPPPPQRVDAVTGPAAEEEWTDAVDDEAMAFFGED